MKPKSMWNRRPSVHSMRLSRWRSPMPRMYVITQYPAQLRTKVSSTSARSPLGPAAAQPEQFLPSQVNASVPSSYRSSVQLP